MTERTCPGYCCEALSIGRKTKPELLLQSIADMPPEWIEEHLIPLPSNPQVFTCTNFDVETHLCKDYENRPFFMCGEYPYGRSCPFTDCPHYDPRLEQLEIPMHVNFNG